MSLVRALCSSVVPGLARAAALAALVASCKADPSFSACPAAAGASATCAEACKQLYALECRVGSSESQCTRICELTTVGLDDAVRQRVQACYAGAESCAEVNACSTLCGPGGAAVPFEALPDGAVPADGGCLEDAHEENDTLGAASVLALSTEVSGILCAEDDDFYAVSLLGGSVYTFRVVFQERPGTLQLLSSSGIPLDEDTGTELTLNHTALDDETLYVRLASDTEVGAYVVEVAPL